MIGRIIAANISFLEAIDVVDSACLTAYTRSEILVS